MIGERERREEGEVCACTCGCLTIIFNNFNVYEILKRNEIPLEQEGKNEYKEEEQEEIVAAMSKFNYFQYKKQFLIHTVLFSSFFARLMN